MTAAKPSDLPKQPTTTNWEGFDITATSAHILASIATLDDDVKDKISAVHTTIMGLPEERDFMTMYLNILPFFETYASFLKDNIHCAENSDDREMLIDVNKFVNDLANNRSPTIKQQLLTLLDYVVRYESGTLLPKGEHVSAVSEIEVELRSDMVKDLLGGFILPYQAKLSGWNVSMSNSSTVTDIGQIEADIEAFRADSWNSLSEKIKFRTMQNLTRTEQAWITSAHWKLFEAANSAQLEKFEAAFQTCIDWILESLKADPKYDVWTAIDDFKKPYLDITAWNWTETEEVV